VQGNYLLVVKTVSIGESSQVVEEEEEEEEEKGPRSHGEWMQTEMQEYPSVAIVVAVRTRCCFLSIPNQMRIRFVKNSEWFQCTYVVPATKVSHNVARFVARILLYLGTQSNIACV
jgi:hypothetical protein